MADNSPSNRQPLRIDGPWMGRAAGLSPAQLVNETGVGRTLECTAELLTCAGLRPLLFKLDALLATGGTLEIECPAAGEHGARRRSASQIQYAVGCLFRDSYRLVARGPIRLTFTKVASSRSYDLAIRGISLGFISDGKALAQLDRILAAVFACTKLTLEIMICGPIAPLEELRVKYPGLRLLGDVGHADLRPPINKKKARIIEAASHENLILAHDRFFFDREWFNRFLAFGNLFDFYNCRSCDWAAYPAEIRVHGDWCYMRRPATGFGYEASTGTAEYGRPNPDAYQNGGLYIGKTALFRSVGWPTHLHWSDLEDVHFSRQLELAGAVVQFDQANRVFTTVKRVGRYEQGGVLRRLKARLGSELRRQLFVARHGRDFVD